MWNANEVRSKTLTLIIGALLLLASGCAFLLAAFASAADPKGAVAGGQAELLIVEHAYDGPIESAGVLVGWQYTDGRMLVEWSDTTTDGVFRNAFEIAP